MDSFGISWFSSELIGKAALENIWLYGDLNLSISTTLIPAIANMQAKCEPEGPAPAMTILNIKTRSFEQQILL